jgi:EAL domain-containing protein (putative c-di-GMP-specific phosphodiesterase class I)
LRLCDENDLTKIPIAINMSARQFQDKALIKKIENALNDFHIEPDLIKIEITESTAMVEVNTTIDSSGGLKSLLMTLVQVIHPWHG